MAHRSQLMGGAWAPSPQKISSSTQMNSPNPNWGTQFDSSLVDRRNIRSDACYVEKITSDYTVPMEAPVRVKPMGHGMTSQSGWEMTSRQTIADAAADELHTEQARMEGEQGRSHADFVAQSTGSASLNALEASLGDKQSVAMVLNNVVASLQEELQLQTADRQDVEEDLSHLTDALRALDKCDKARLQRPKKEMVRDGLEYALRKYELALTESSELLNQLAAAFETDQNRIVDLRRRVVADIEEKGEAIRLDQVCLNTTTPNQSSTLDQVEHLKSHTMKYSWEQTTNQLLQEVSRTLQNAAKLRVKAAELRHTKGKAQAESLAMACEAMEAKAAATRTLKETAQFELSKIQEALDLTSREHAKLQQAIAEKAIPLRVAEERLRTRNLRPDREKIRDRAEQALEREVELLTQSVEELTRALHAVTKNLHKLEETRQKLMTDVESKSQALGVDTLCLSHIHEARMAPVAGNMRHC